MLRLRRDQPSGPTVVSASGELIRLAWPLLMSSFFVMASGVVDIAVIGHISGDALAGVSIGLAFYLVAYSVVSPIATAHQIQAARSFGSEALDDVRTSLLVSLRTAILAAGVLMIVTLLVARPLVTATTRTPAAADAGFDYLGIRSLELPFAVPMLLLIGTMASAKRTRPSMWAFATANLVNIALDIYLVVYLRLGAAGSAWGNVIGTLVALIVVVMLYHQQSRVIGLDGLRELLVRAKKRVGWSEHLRFVRLAAPLGVSGLLDYVGAAVLFAVIGRIATDGAAGARGVYTIMLTLFIVMRAFANAGQILLGRSRGATDSALERRTLLASLAVIGSTAAVAAAGLAILPRHTGAILLEGELARGAEAGVRLLAFAILVMAVTLTLTAAVRSQGRTSLDMWGNLSAVWLVQVPAVVILSNTLSVPSAMAVGLLLYWLARAAILLYPVSLSVGRYE